MGAFDPEAGSWATVGSRPGTATYVFNCGECDAEFVVDEGVREALLEAFCAVCGADVSPAAFERRDAKDA